MAITKQKIKQFIARNKGILLFFAAMFGANILWKLVISGSEESETIVFLRCCDWSATFNTISEHVARVTYFVVHKFDSSVTLTNGDMLNFPNGQGVQVVWSCSGVKQMFIFFIIMLLASGNHKHKLWFIPLGLSLCYLINILRTTILTLIIKDCPEIFPLMHNHILKYLYYVLIFLIWMVWEERVKFWGTKQKA